MKHRYSKNFSPDELEELAHSAAWAAAEWWGARLRDASGLGNNGDNGLSSTYARGMTNIIRDRNPPTEKHAEAFEDALFTNIIDAFHKIDADDTKDIGCSWYYDDIGFDEGGPDICLTVDYHPCGILHAALIEAGIERNVAEVAALPLKTVMKVSRRRVLVAHGYKSPFVEIWGPWWGSTYLEHREMDDGRVGKITSEAYDEHRKKGPRTYSPLHWYGPVHKVTQ